MIRGMYASAAGMLTGLAQQDLLAGNLANASTVGYRRTRCATRAFAQTLDTVSQAADMLRGGEGPVEATLDTSEGAVKPTGGKYDLAINGAGYFAVQTPQGTRYTRDGRFHASAGGRLVDARGNPVMGVNGFIDLKGGDFQVDEVGEVKSGGRVVGEILVAAVPAASLKAVGGGLYAAGKTPAAAGGTPAPPGRAVGARLMQGSLEDSNVSAVRELGAMMQNSRYYEANAAALKQQDQTVEELVRDI